MLDRGKLFRELQSQVERLFQDNSAEVDRAREIWQRLCADPLFAQRVTAANMPWSMPKWTGEVDARFAINVAPSSYTILAVDGSQIYPDRHQSAACSLINIGTVEFSYNQTKSTMQRRAEPSIIFAADEEGGDDGTDLINCLREEFELRAGLEKGRTISKDGNVTHPFLTLFDGSLIFWHLEAKDEVTKERFLPAYLGILDQAARLGLWMASYISYPKSRELVGLVRAYEYLRNGSQMETSLCDSNVVHFYLEPGQRSTIFANQATITKRYPDHLKPHFFYINGDEEIGRVEMPAWMAQDNKIVDTIASLIFDQIKKGRGYPISLAEAHEAAVVKGPDRDFFYHAVQKLTIEHKKRYAISRKSFQKRSIGI